MTAKEPDPRGADAEHRSREQLARLAAELSDVEIVANIPPWPRPRTPAEKRAERSVALWFVLSGLSAIAFVVAYTIWPSDYVSPGEDGATLYALYTPVIGATFAVSVLALGIGLITYIKKFFPHEVSVQQLHNGPSNERARATAVALFEQTSHDTGIPRRSLITRAALGATGLFGIAAGVLAIGGFVRYPWKGGDQAAKWITGWKPLNGDTVYLRAETGVLGNIVRVRPGDMQPGSMQTVFPYRESDRGDEALLLAAERASDAPVMLIRLHPGTEVTKRPGQENFNYGDYYAFSKICTHLGCPASQYESKTNISLCPCHQSEFLITESAKPIFGPAARPLPQLPITVNAEGYFVARGDFIEPVGPVFWEMRTR